MARRFLSLMERAPINSTTDLFLMFANHQFGHSHSGTLRTVPLLCVETFLLSLSARIDHSPEFPFWRFEIMAIFVVRLWAANSCNIQDVGLSGAYIFPKMKSPPMLSVAIGIASRDKSLFSRRFGAHSPITT